MDAKEAAAVLNGNEYRNEGSKELFAAMKSAGLVAVFGASDDLMEFRGAIYDEVGCYGGGTAYVTSTCLNTPSCDNDACPHEKALRASAQTIDAIFGEYGLTFTYDTEIPHETFVINEDGEPYCRGIVFALADVQP